MGNMCSVSIAAGDTVARCWDCTAGQAKYTVHLEDNLAALKVELEELRELRNDVLRRVILDEQKQLQRLDQVQGWLSRADTQIAEIDELVRDASRQVEKLCLGGCFSRSPLSGYKFGKLVAKKLRHVADLKGKGVFEVVAERMPVCLVDERPSETTVGLEAIFGKVWNCLTEEDVGTIGIYGMGGIGKTTLLTKLNNEFLNSSYGYDVVIWVTVSKDFDVERIQEEIGKRIDLLDVLLKSNRLDHKAADIHRVLTQRKYVLLLDDLWQRVNLIDIGVPFPSARNGSKVVFTSRSKEVCAQMEAQRIFKVECLNTSDSWKLFEKKVGHAMNTHPDIPNLARILVKRCCGLPLALTTVGRAMACKVTPQEWHHATGIFSKCASNFSGMGDDVLPILKFSFDSLRSDQLRCCFLYCLLFPGGIHKSHLIDYWIGEGLLDDFSPVSTMHNLGHYVIGTLVYACLLEDKGDFVVMHDVIRDMASWIACELGRKKNFVIKSGARLTEAPEIREWEGVERMSLMVNSIETLVEAPTCPDLQTLILRRNCLKTISNDFFQFMPSLTALDLSSNKNLVELPTGISRLASLQYFNLSMTALRLLPAELKNLVRMRCLNLDHTSALLHIPMQVISSFYLLQVLRMVNCGIETGEGENGTLSCGGEPLVAELESLQQLELLCITITSEIAFQKLLSSHKFNDCTRHLTLQNFGNSKSVDISSMNHMKHLDVFRMSNCLQLEVLKYGAGVEGEGTSLQVPRNLGDILSIKCFNSLCKVYTYNCPRLKDLTWIILAPNLTFLWVSLCFEMGEIISTGKLTGLLQIIPLQKLQVLYLSHLLKLKSVYNNGHAFLDPGRLRIIVHNCPKLKGLPLKSSSYDRRKTKTVEYGKTRDEPGGHDKPFSTNPATWS